MLLTPAIIRCIIRHHSGLYTCIQLLGKQEFFRKTSQKSAKKSQKPIKIGQNSSKRKSTAKPKSEVHTVQSRAQPSRAHGTEQARCKAQSTQGAEPAKKRGASHEKSPRGWTSKKNISSLWRCKAKGDTDSEAHPKTKGGIRPTKKGNTRW